MHTRTFPFFRGLAVAVITVAFLCGIRASAQIYSVNAIGYVNVTFHPGTNLFANPLDNFTGNTVGAVLSGVPDNTKLYLYQPENGTYVANQYHSSLGWENPAMSLPPGEGALLCLPPGSSPMTYTFVGEIQQGTLANNLSQGYSLKGSMVPQAGRLQTDLLFPATDGDSVYLHNASTQAYSRYDYSAAGGWTPSEPILAVAQGFILSNHVSGTAWVQSLDVNGTALSDIGLRVFDGTNIRTILCETPGPGGTLVSPLRIARNGQTYGIALVETNSPGATAIRVNTSSGPKALALGTSIVQFTDIRRNGDGTVNMEWTGGGTLQSAPTVLGPWMDVTGATSPYTFTPTAPMLFGRIRQ